MCATCVAEGVTYVGGAVAGLRLMAVRAGMRTRRTRVSEDRELAPSTQNPQV